MVMRNFIYVFVLLFCFACGDDDNVTPNTDPDSTALFSDIDIVTGLQLRDENASLIGTVGNPNIKNEDSSIYPNPANSVVTISSPINTIETVWILPGNQTTDFGDVDFQSKVGAIMYDQTQLDESQVGTFGLNGPQINLNLQDFDNGYYRIFYHMTDGELRWDNFYLNKDLSGSELSDKVFEDWN